MCIFPSDGTNRIRFTGKDYRVQSQPNASGSPKTICFCDNFIIPRQGKMSRKKQRHRLCFSVWLSHFQCQLFAAQDVEVKMMHGLTGIVAAVGDHPVAVC